MAKKTPLYQQHQQAGATLVDFAGWDMPLHYGSQLQEHHQVRRHAGMFDVSHMTVVDVEGVDARAYLRYLLANDIAKLRQPSKALYTCMLNPAGGVIDDLIVYFFDEQHYRLVVNSSTREKDLAWLQAQTAGFKVELREREEVALIAVQGPKARELATTALFDAADQAVLATLLPFQGVTVGNDVFVARTGYTGEDGFEMMLPADAASQAWQQLLAAGVAPCGLGARDTLRLEAGLNLYGADMDESTSPLESNLSWTVAFNPPDRNFIGRTALTAALESTQGVTRQLVGLVLEEKGVLRNHQKITVADVGEGEITSGSFSPTMNVAIALARIPVTEATHCMVDIRGRLLPARIVKPPFVRHGKCLV